MKDGEGVGDVNEWKDGVKVAALCSVGAFLAVWVGVVVMHVSLVGDSAVQCVGENESVGWWDICGTINTGAMPFVWLATSFFTAFFVAVMFAFSLRFVPVENAEREEPAFVDCVRKLFGRTFVYALTTYALLLPFALAKPALSLMYIILFACGGISFFAMVSQGYRLIGQRNETRRTTFNK